MEDPEPTVKHLWDGRWEQQPEPNTHIGVMYLKEVMTFMKIPIPLTSSNLQARQVFAFVKGFPLLQSAFPLIGNKEF